MNGEISITLIPKSKTIYIPKIKYGPNGISYFDFIFLNTIYIHIRLNNAPIQNARTIADRPAFNPRTQPIPRTSFASPNPIHLPLDRWNMRAKGNARIGP